MRFSCVLSYYSWLWLLVWYPDCEVALYCTVCLFDLQPSGVPMTLKAPEELDFMFDEEIGAFNGGRQNSFTEWSVTRIASVY